MKRIDKINYYLDIAEATLGIPFRASTNPLDTLVNGTPYTGFDNSLVGQLSILQDYIAPGYDANLTNPNTGAVSTAAKRGNASKGTSWKD